VSYGWLRLVAFSLLIMRFLHAVGDRICGCLWMVCCPTVAQGDRRSLLDDAQRRMASFGIEADTAAPVGDAATEIVATAKVIGGDGIVVAQRHGHVPNLLGSVSGRIVRSANCDVLVVHEAPAARDPDGAPDEGG
jgi:hypothetical protein